MNMISTGAFLNEMDASNKQPTVAEKFAAVWEKKNAKAARAGGVSLMALSLAACGSSSTTKTTTDTSNSTNTTVDAAKSIALKTTVDVAPDTDGGSGNDTYVADNTGTANTLTIADELNGYGGTDTIKIYSDGNGDVAGQFTSIEIASIYDLDDTFDLTGVDGLTTVNVIRGDGTQVIKVDAGETINLEDITLSSTNGAADITLDYGATATTATFGLNKVVAGGTPARDDVTLVGAKLTTVNVNVTGTKSVVEKIDALQATAVNIDAAVALETNNVSTTSAAATLTITGAGNVDVGGLDVGFTTVNAAGNSGGIVAAIGTNDDTVLTGSTGDDVITASTTDALASTDKLAVDAGDGTDILVISANADVNTAADAARYTNFETVRVSDDYDGDTIAGITALQLTGASSKSYTDLTAAQAGSVQVRGDETSPTFTLKNATGSSDAITLTMGTGLTTSAATDIVTGMTITGFETLNVVENGGATATAGANRTAIVAAITSTTVTDINLTGRAVTISDVATTKAVDIDGSELTGNGNTGTSVQGLTVAGSAKAGSTITGSAFNDSMTVGAEGSTYNAGAGTDAFSATAALILADGTTDLVLDGGAGTDTLTLTNTTGNTLTDAHFTNISNMEKLTLTNTGAGDTSITTGSSFNSAFSDGVTITSGIIAATKDITIAGGLSTVDMTVTIAATSQTGAATETNSIVTGSGDDTVTYTDTGWVGAASTNASGTFAIDTNAGDDTISLTVGTLTNDQTANFITITGGSGQDSITKVGTNDDDGTGVVGHVTFEFAAGDSNTVNYDTITGFDLATATLVSDELDFEGTAAIGSFTSHDDFGTIKSHSVTAGVATFDDAAGFASALVIDADNLADVVGYLAANMTANHVVAFTYDSTGSGTADGTMVFHQGSAASVADDLVFLAGTTAVDALITTNNEGANDMFIA